MASNTQPQRRRCVDISAVVWNGSIGSPRTSQRERGGNFTHFWFDRFTSLDGAWRRFYSGIVFLGHKAFDSKLREHLSWKVNNALGSKGQHTSPHPHRDSSPCSVWWGTPGKRALRENWSEEREERERIQCFCWCARWFPWSGGLERCFPRLYWRVLPALMWSRKSDKFLIWYKYLRKPFFSCKFDFLKRHLKPYMFDKIWFTGMLVFPVRENVPS